MTEILNMVINQDNVAKTTSLKVAEVFGKEHKKVIRKIEEIIKKMADSSNEAKNGPVKIAIDTFKKITYTDTKGESRPCYEMTRDGFTLLVMGFNGDKAFQFKLKYIDAFNKMEEEIVNKKNNKLSFDNISMEDFIIQAGKTLEKRKKENEELIQKVINTSLEAKGKYQRDEISAKINAQIRKVAQETNTPYANVWARLYRMFENNKKRWWWGNAMQAKNHWEFISKNAPLEDLKIMFDYAKSFDVEVANKEFFAQNIDSKGEVRKIEQPKPSKKKGK